MLLAVLVGAALVVAALAVGFQSKVREQPRATVDHGLIEAHGSWQTAEWHVPPEVVRVAKIN